MSSIRLYILGFGLSIAVISCVPAKKYNELLAKEQQCSSELEKYKTTALNADALAKELQTKLSVLNSEIVSIKKDTTLLGQDYRTLNAKYLKLSQQNEALETEYNKLRLSGAKDAAQFSKELEARLIELQRKEDELATLETELVKKQELLSEREQRVNELEEMIRRKDAATNELKTKIALALKGFENKGLTVEERNGKIYVSLEAKLLFPSGSTEVQAEGKSALVELSKVLQDNKELEIIVEGHTDTDKLISTKHPKSNWELSVLRATSVIEIMLANSSIDPKQLMAAGRSEFHPVDENDKAKNRRIEIIISPNLNELYELITQ